MKTDVGRAKSKEKKQSVRRRDILRALGFGAGAAAVAASAPLVEPAAAQTESDAEKRKARYQPNSADVQNYYRVNRYPK
jgi:sugar (pentulose or hexulose) kinase